MLRQHMFGKGQKVRLNSGRRGVIVRRLSMLDDDGKMLKCPTYTVDISGVTHIVAEDDLSPSHYHCLVCSVEIELVGDKIKEHRFGSTICYGSFIPWHSSRPSWVDLC